MKKINQQTIEFLQRVIGKNPYEIHLLKGDASDRIYSRIQQKNKTFILMQYPHPFTSLPSFLNMQKHFQKHNIAVPHIYSYNQDHGLVLLEDLGDILLQDISSKDRLEFYQQAIDQLIKIHHYATNDPSPCHALQVIFDKKKLMEEMEYTQEHLLESYCHIVLSDQYKKELQKEFMDICSRLDQNPKCIIHRDFHSRNIMIVSNQVKIIDFQDARMALCQYDLTSLLKDAYTDIDQTMEDTLINDYLIKSKEVGQSFSRAEFMELYHLHTIQRCFKACGSFASFYHLKKNTGYLKYIPKALKHVSHALSYFPKYKLFKSLFTDHDIIHLAQKGFL